MAYYELEEDAWDIHFKETGHSCGQVNDWFYCLKCGWESGNRPGPVV